MARQRFISRGSPRKRATFWGRSPADTAPTSLAASTAVLDSTSVPLIQGETIVRVRGAINVSSDQQTVTENQLGAVGFLIASDEAVAVGVGSIPTPYTDQDSDLWFVHRYFANRTVFSSGVGVDFNVMFEYSFDSKAMRKIETGSTLCVVVENGSTTGLLYTLNYAVLFKVA